MIFKFKNYIIMSKLQLINGKFIRDGKEVPIEIGNSEQIKLYKEANRRAEQFENGDCEVNIDLYNYSVDYSLYFTCICGNIVSESGIYDIDNIVSFNETDVCPKTIKCKKCNRSYHIKDGYIQLLK